MGIRVIEKKEGSVMSVIVVYDPDDKDVPGKVVTFHKSANTPDYKDAKNTLINPDLSGVDGVPQKHWKVSGGVVVAASTEEKTVVDDARKPTPTVCPACEHEWTPES